MDSEVKNIQYFDTLRALATLAVITIHVNTPVMNMNFGKNMEYWTIGLIINNLIRFVIPIFLVISGATLLTKNESYLVFYKKRFSKVFVPFLFWLPAYWVFRWFMLRAWERPHDFDSIIAWALKLFIREGVSVHLWFVYMILLLYLFVPFIARILRKIDKKVVVLFVALWLLFNTLQSIGIININFESILYQRLFNYSLHVGYLLLGYLLHTASPNFLPKRSTSFAVYSTTVFLAIITTYFLSVSNGKQTLTTMGTFQAFAFTQTIAVFYLFKNYEIKNHILKKLMQLISNYSFGIYFVHIMIISLFYRIGIFWTMAHPLISIPLVVLLTLITSICVIFLLRKIPFITKFAG
ncbi:MAG: acyltransferase [Paludibacter sp.]